MTISARGVSDTKLKNYAECAQYRHVNTTANGINVEEPESTNRKNQVATGYQNDAGEK